MQRAMDSLERSLERIVDRQRETRKLQETLPKIKWLGKDYELAKWLEAAWKQEKIKAKSWKEALEKILPHFTNEHGKQFDAKSFAVNLSSKRDRDAGKKK